MRSERESVLGSLCAWIAEHFDLGADQVGSDTRFVEDLGADSLDVIEMALAVEETYGIRLRDSELARFEAVADAATFILAHRGRDAPR